jgi:hypothetical protein
MTQLIKFITVILWALLIGTAISADAAIPSISLNGIVYSNVVIESTSAKAITFSHTRGMASVNRQKLTFDEKVALELAAPAPTNSVSSTKPDTNNVASVEIRKVFDASRDAEKHLRDAGVSLKAVSAGAIVLYMFFCFCLLMICSKANQPSPLLVFIPFVQILPAYRAAKMSPFWFRLLMVDLVFRVTVGVLTYTGHIGRLPQAVAMVLLVVMVVFTLIHLIGWIIWCFKICIAREKSPLVGIFMLLPCTQVLALAYLAFSE